MIKGDDIWVVDHLEDGSLVLDELLAVLHIVLINKF